MLSHEHANRFCPHLTTPLYCICREQGYDPVLGCAVSVRGCVRSASDHDDPVTESSGQTVLSIMNDLADE